MSKPNQYSVISKDGQYDKIHQSKWRINRSFYLIWQILSLLSQIRQDFKIKRNVRWRLLRWKKKKSWEISDNLGSNWSSVSAMRPSVFTSCTCLWLELLLTGPPPGHTVSVAYKRPHLLVIALNRLDILLCMYSN